jgi:hypothetical protein
LPDLFATIERELGLSPLIARKRLLPDLKGLLIDARLPKLSPLLRERFAEGDLIFYLPNDDTPRVSRRGWELLDAPGRLHDTLAGARVEIRWAQVVEALADTGRASANPTRTAPRLRPAGLNYELADQPLLEAMHRLICDGGARGPWDAALAVVKTAEGAGSPQSKAKRLSGRYSAAFRAERGGEDGAPR